MADFSNVVSFLGAFRGWEPKLDPDPGIAPSVTLGFRGPRLVRGMGAEEEEAIVLVLGAGTAVEDSAAISDVDARVLLSVSV